MAREYRANHCKNVFNELVLTQNDRERLGEKFEWPISFSGLMLLLGFARNIMVPPALCRTLVQS